MKAPLLALPLILAIGCHNPATTCPEAATSLRPAAPLEASVDPVARAQTHPMPTAQPTELPGIHNILHLGSHIVSGGEPMGRESLATLAELGIKTILSVDGKVPDAASASEQGMRYVHIPIQYSGIDEVSLAQIAKTFRELEGPFFVHCFHGKHRGPAAAAVGRLVLDGISRDQAMAEMHQWCGTSLKYVGLFQTIGLQEMPSLESTAALDFDFPAAHTFAGFRGTMIPMARSWDEIKFARKRDWALNPAKPDIVPAQEALQLSQIFASCLEQSDLPADTEEVRGWLQDGQQGTSDLARILSGQNELGAKGEDWRAQAESAYRVVSKSCKDCHTQYRN
ncbi:MAG: dual specificity protein phosphatase family protein [bacterium]|nr:dual specificity protein phosphatase family protein [bacterium]